jgi:DNA replication and repair protein RecF
VLVVGPNGVGKTNLLESVHVGTQGFSPRTRADTQLIRFGETAARIGVRGRRNSVPLAIDVTLEAGAAKHATINGAPLRGDVATLVFTPDRLAIVKGAPATRRAYFDRALGRLSPARAQLPAEYGAAIAQRNASLRRIAAGFSSRVALAPWTERVADLGTDLVAARWDVLALLGPSFAERAGELGLPDAELRYAGEAPTAAMLEERLERDLERGATGAGPHLDDIVIASGARELRSFGSQGEQRLAVLALLLAEAEVLAERRDSPPLLLLDDVLSELDPERRRILAARVGQAGQALITATDRAMLPVDPDQLVEVGVGTAK